MIIFDNTKAFSFQKILEKSEYLFGILTFLVKNKAICAFQAGCIKIEFTQKVTYIIKTLIFLFNAALANFFLLINSTYLVVGKASAVI